MKRDHIKYLLQLKIVKLSINHNISFNRRMKVFQLIQRNLIFLGFDPINPYNMKIAGCFLLIGLITTMCLMFLFCVANTFMEYTQCIYFTVAVIGINIVFITLVSQMNKLFALIDRIQQHVDGELKRHALRVILGLNF